MDMDVRTWESLVSTETAPGAITTPATGTSLQAVRVEFAPHSSFAEHTHPHEQMSIILSGRAIVHVEGQSREIGPGSVVLVPPHQSHGMTILDEPVVSIEVFTPPRADLRHDSPS